MRRLISYMFTSLDGFIADRDGGLDWVPIDDELMRFANTYFAAAGGIVFGRNVHEGFVSYWDELDAANPSVTELEAEFAQIFGSMKRIVASNTLRDASEGTIVDPDHDLPSTPEESSVREDRRYHPDARHERDPEPFLRPRGDEPMRPLDAEPARRRRWCPADRTSRSVVDPPPTLSACGRR